MSCPPRLLVKKKDPEITPPPPPSRVKWSVPKCKLLTNFVVNPQEKLKLVKFCVPDRMKVCGKPIRHELRSILSAIRLTSHSSNWWNWYIGRIWNMNILIEELLFMLFLFSNT